ncbi:MAG: winged helix-turn-helix domain-containing protein [Methanobacteriaceae archaeon]
MNTNTIDQVSFIKASKHRANILLFIGDELKTPTEIAKNVDIGSKHISKYLNGLKDKDLVVCLNPDAKKGRLYQLTPEAKQLLKHISNN